MLCLGLKVILCPACLPRASQLNQLNLWLFSLSKSCQKIVKKLSKYCQNIVKILSNIVKNNLLSIVKTYQNYPQCAKNLPKIVKSLPVCNLVCCWTCDSCLNLLGQYEHL